MLTLTGNAAVAVKTMAEVTPNVSSDSGLRIHAETTDEDRVGLELTMVERPTEGDQVIEEGGARVFVEAETVPYVEDKILDAVIEDNRVQFSLSGRNESSAEPWDGSGARGKES